MVATPRYWWGPEQRHTYRDTPFTAKFPGECAGCGQRFDAGDSVVYRGSEVHIDHDCDGTARDIQLPDDDQANVMPRGKSVADRCDRCFIVHASGQVDCE